MLRNRTKKGKKEQEREKQRIRNQIKTENSKNGKMKQGSESGHTAGLQQIIHPVQPYISVSTTKCSLASTVSRKCK